MCSCGYGSARTLFSPARRRFWPGCSRSRAIVASTSSAARRQEAAERIGTPAGDADDPQRRAEDRLLADDVRRVLAELPARQRRAVELAIFGGLTHSEIAGALGAPLGTVKSWLRQGLRQLRATLGPSWPGGDA
jgi:RNA polymerase sigma-70 factor, ECF subfamily